jgi:hypothetical protein
MDSEIMFNQQLRMPWLGAGRLAQVVEHLPSKCEVLSSNPTTKKEKMSWLGPVHACNPTYSTYKQRSGGLQFEASPGKKLMRSHLNQ